MIHYPSVWISKKTSPSQLPMSNTKTTKDNCMYITLAYIMLDPRKATMISYAENFAGKGVDDVISNLDCYIEENKAAHHTNLTIYADNCFLQNKNRYLWT